MDIWIKDAAKRAAAKLTLTASLAGCAGSHKLVEVLDASGDAAPTADAPGDAGTLDAHIQLVDATAPMDAQADATRIQVVDARAAGDAGMCLTPHDPEANPSVGDVACCVAVLGAAQGRGMELRDGGDWGPSEGFRTAYGVRFASAEDRASQAVSDCCGWFVGSFNNPLRTALAATQSEGGLRESCCEVTADGPVGCTPWGPVCPVSLDGVRVRLFA